MDDNLLVRDGLHCKNRQMKEFRGELTLIVSSKGLQIYPDSSE